MRQVDSSNRPVFLGAGFSPTGKVEGMLGELPDGLGVYHEDNLAQYEGASAILLVGSASKGLVVFLSEPVINVYPEYAPAALISIVQVYQYAAAAILNRGGAFSAITGRCCVLFIMFHNRKREAYVELVGRLTKWSEQLHPIGAAVERQMAIDLLAKARAVQSRSVKCLQARQVL